MGCASSRYCEARARALLRQMDPLFDDFVRDCCTRGDDRYVARLTLSHAFARYIDGMLMEDAVAARAGPTDVAEALLNRLLEDRGCQMMGYVRLSNAHSAGGDLGGATLFDPDQRTVFGLSLDRSWRAGRPASSPTGSPARGKDPL